MYSVDGVPLQNPARGWRFKRASEPSVGRSYSRADFNAANRDGTKSVRGNITTPTFTLVAQAPGSTYEALRQLLRMGASVTLTSNPAVAIAVEAMTVTPRTVTPAGGGLYELTVVYRCPQVWWRDVATTDWTSTIAGSGGTGAANMAILTASSAPVQDLLILVQGAMVNPKLAGQNGTWIAFTGTTPTRASGGGLLIDAARGRCWVNPSTDLWGEAGSNDQTGYLNTGAYPYFLELAPSSTALGAVLGISWASHSEAVTVTVRGRNANDL